MIKVLAPAQRHPSNRSLDAFHNYWAESHGPLFANTSKLRGYVQHLTLHEAYGLELDLLSEHENRSVGHCHLQSGGHAHGAPPGPDHNERQRVHQLRT